MQDTVIALKTIDLGYEMMLQFRVDKLNLRLEGVDCFVLEADVCVLLQGGL
jgi:hypothetical protein